MNSTSLYPLKFKPILKEKVWGGNKLHTVLGKQAADEIGESWELSGVEGNISVVANGPLAGKNLNELIVEYGAALVGTKVHDAFGAKFPLLFKFIDAREDLSVQLHPNDELAQQRHNSFGKTEMWYIVNADDHARLILGFNQPMDASRYQQALSDGAITDILNSESIVPGDAFFIAPGTVHAIGGGTLLAEIQQTSDITYRIYDWDRPDRDGNMRELHTEEALAAIDYQAPDPRLSYSKENNKPSLVCSCNYFETNEIVLNEPMELSFPDHDSFRVYMCVAGGTRVQTDNFSVSLVKGETILVPASIGSVQLDTEGATILEVYVP